MAQLYENKIFSMGEIFGLIHLFELVEFKSSQVLNLNDHSIKTWPWGGELAKICCRCFKLQSVVE